MALFGKWIICNEAILSQTCQDGSIHSLHKNHCVPLFLTKVVSQRGGWVGTNPFILLLFCLKKVGVKGNVISILLELKQIYKISILNRKDINYFKTLYFFILKICGKWNLFLTNNKLKWFWMKTIKKHLTFIKLLNFSIAPQCSIFP